MILSTAYENDINNLCVALHSLRYLPGDKDEPPAGRAPVLVFNEGNINEEKMIYLNECNGDYRTLAFPIIHLNEHFPPDFGNPQIEYEAYKKSVGLSHLQWEGRPPVFSYANMIRFWTYFLWRHPAIQQFETIMRMDTDSCWMPEGFENNKDLQHLPFLPPKYVYHSFGPGDGVTRHFFDYDTRTFFGTMKRPLIDNIEKNDRCQQGFVAMRIQGLYEEWRRYLKQQRLTSTYPEMWQATMQAYKQFCTLPTFETHFEVGRREFFQRAAVDRWHEHLSEREPFGILRHRWGDAQTRFMTMAMFGNKNTVLVTGKENGAYAHGRDFDTPEREFRCQTLYGEKYPTFPEWSRNRSNEKE